MKLYMVKSQFENGIQQSLISNSLGNFIKINSSCCFIASDLDQEEFAKKIEDLQNKKSLGQKEEILVFLMGHSL